MMNSYAENIEDELTVDLPSESVMVRTIGLVSAEVSNEMEIEEATVVESLPIATIYPAHYEPPVGRALRRYFQECRQRARELRERERVEYAHTLYQRSRRLMLRIYAHMKKNATSRPWEDYEASLGSTPE